MSEGLTKTQARNIFFGGSLFFFVVFAGLTAHSHLYAVNTSTNNDKLTESVARGKHVWEKNSCINCHTLHGEGAYFAPEVGNVMTRWGVQDSPDDAFEMLKGWMDRVWASGVAWELPEGSNLVKPLLRDVRRLLIVTSHGSSKWVNILEGESGKRTIIRSLRAMCRRRVRTRWVAIYGIDTCSSAKRATFLDRVEQAATRLR